MIQKLLTKNIYQDIVVQKPKGRYLQKLMRIFYDFLYVFHSMENRTSTYIKSNTLSIPTCFNNNIKIIYMSVELAYCDTTQNRGLRWLFGVVSKYIDVTKQPIHDNNKDPLFYFQYVTKFLLSFFFLHFHFHFHSTYQNMNICNA